MNTVFSIRSSSLRSSDQIANFVLWHAVKLSSSHRLWWLGKTMPFRPMWHRSPTSGPSCASAVSSWPHCRPSPERWWYLRLLQHSTPSPSWSLGCLLWWIWLLLASGMELCSENLSSYNVVFGNIEWSGVFHDPSLLGLVEDWRKKISSLSGR